MTETKTKPRYRHRMEENYETPVPNKECHNHYKCGDEVIYEEIADYLE